MSSIDSKELFEQYYQNEYDFNTASLSAEEIKDIKQLAKEKRVDYALAPMGTGIFHWIQGQSKNIRFEMVAFDSDKIDGMLYIPTSGQECAYIILNANKPLINQVFTAAHEYYHYIRDYQRFRDNPYICDFSMLKDVNEKCASRFAAELLLPEAALLQELNVYMAAANISSRKQMTELDYAAFAIVLTIRYQMPLKAVIYRLAEEEYINNVNKYIKDYEFIKKIIREISVIKTQVDELYSCENKYVVSLGTTYQDMEKAFRAGNVTREKLIEDAEKLEMDRSLVDAFCEEDAEDKDEDDESDLFSILNNKLRGM